MAEKNKPVYVKQPDVMEVRKFLKELRNCVLALVKKNNNMLTEMHRRVHDHEKLLKRIAYTNECVDESLCNVLMAIRQNEYLHAWYPAQKGHKEANIVGMHPASVEAKPAPSQVEKALDDLMEMYEKSIGKKGRKK